MDMVHLAYQYLLIFLIQYVQYQEYFVIKKFFQQNNIEYKEIFSTNGGILTKLIQLIYIFDYTPIYLAIIKKVLALKAYKSEIIDKKRISTILKKIKKESFKRNIDPKITHRIWKNMIWSYINFEKKNFKKK